MSQLNELSKLSESTRAEYEAFKKELHDFSRKFGRAKTTKEVHAEIKLASKMVRRIWRLQRKIYREDLENAKKDITELRQRIEALEKK